MSHLITQSDSLSGQEVIVSRQSWHLKTYPVPPYINLFRAFNGKYVCDICGQLYRTVLKVNFKSKDHPYMFDKFHCLGCLSKAEQKVAKRIPFDRLPLFINHVWVTWVGEYTYKMRLKGEL